MTAYLKRRFMELSREDQGVLVLIVASLLVHIGFLTVHKQAWWTPSSPLFEEWQMEADLFVGDSLVVPNQSSLPKAQIAEEAKVPETMLPQISKKFAVKETADEKETDAEEGAISKVDKKSDKEVEAKAEKEIPIKGTKEDSNKIEQEDALRRLALEKLRQDEKFSKKLQAQQNDAIAKLKMDNSKDNGMNAGAGGLSGSQRAQYIGLVSAHMRRCYTIPQAYNMKDLKTSIGVVISERGDVVSSVIRGPSHDKVFDELAYKAVSDCAPLPKPPKAIAGMEITLNFASP